MAYNPRTDETSGRPYGSRDAPSPRTTSSPSSPPSDPSFPHPVLSPSSSYTQAPTSVSDYGDYALPDSIGRMPPRTTTDTSFQSRTTEQVTLDEHGNFVFDRKIPAKLREKCPQIMVMPQIAENEFTHVRYSAATCEPDQFEAKGFTLRQKLPAYARPTKLFIVVTMFNENDVLFCRTMYGVMKNIAHLCDKKVLGWEEVVVCIVADGRQKINLRTLDYITTLGAYQRGVAKNAVNEEPVTAHIFEYTTQMAVDAPPEARGFTDASVPVQIIFCLKEKNQKKLNSHRWFFEAFGPVLQPEVCILLDVGTMPGPTAFYHIWRAFNSNPRLGGACGEIVALKGRHWLNLLNPLVGAQNFEYKMSNILDKSLESIFGYISVLPGAFSAYRYSALQNDSNGKGPLEKYFLAEKPGDPKEQQSIFMANMYLAEDRILCWELVSKRSENWVLHYVKSAYAITDVPDTVPELISQRRRWLNGSLFAAVHSIFNFYYIWRSSHSLLRKLWIHIEMIYQFFNLIFAWFALGNYFIAYKILTEALEDPSFHLGNAIHIVNIVIEYLYVGLLILSFLLALGNKPQGSKWFYTIAIVGFAMITAYMTFASVFLIIRGVENALHSARPLKPSDLFVNPLFRNIVVSIFATLGLYVMASLIQLDAWHLVTSFLQYTFMAPSYINVLNVYAFANVHDVSWGTKGDTNVSTDLGVIEAKEKTTIQVPMPTEQSLDAAYQEAWKVRGPRPPEDKPQPDEQAQREASDRNFRTNVLLAWALSNALLAAVVVTASEKAANSSAEKSVNGYLAFLLFSIAGLAAFRFLGTVTYMVIRLFAKE